MDRIVMAAAAVLLAIPPAPRAAAKAAKLEMDRGFYTLQKLCYVDSKGRPKWTFKEIVDAAGAGAEQVDEVITYDGDSTLTQDVYMRIRLADEVELGRFDLATLDPGLGHEFELVSAVLRRQGAPDESYTETDVQQEAVETFDDFYTSLRTFYLELPVDAAAGSLEIEFRVTIVSPPGMEGFTRGAVMLQTVAYADRRTITFRYPVDHPLYFKQRGFTMKVKPRRDGDLEEVRYELTHLRPGHYERFAAHPLANFPSVMFASLPDWAGYHGRVRAMYEEHAVADDALRAEVAALIEGASSDRERAEAIFRHVSGRIQYLGLYVGESGHMPHDATLVRDRGFGDCKDYTVLLMTMLREAGIDAHPALIQSGIPAFVDPDLPMLVANHAIVRATLDGEPWFLDATTNPYQFETPGPSIRGRTAVVFGADGVEFVETPPAVIDERSVREHVALSIDADGALSADVEVTYDGIPAITLRERFRTRSAEDLRDEDHDRVLVAYRFPEGVTFTHDGDPASGDGPLTRRLTLTSREHVRRSGPVMLVELPWMELPPAIEPKYSPHDFEVFFQPMRYEARLTLQLPPGYAPLALPDDRRSIWPGGKLEVSYGVDGETLVIEATGEWRAARVAPAAAESYPQFRTELAEMLDRTVVLMEVDR